VFFFVKQLLIVSTLEYDISRAGGCWICADSWVPDRGDLVWTSLALTPGDHGSALANSRYKCFNFYPPLSDAKLGSWRGGMRHYVFQEVLSS
jgi:hypothetical protein